MKKFYIPTTTLNFNNILSSESISPNVFYKERGFGYPRWWPLDEKEEDRVIYLYEKPFCFERPSSDLEDHPMLIEYDTYEEFPKVEEGIYYSDHTLYLSPWITRFIFFNESDKISTLSLSDGSIETKLVDLYNNRFIVYDKFDKGDVYSKNIDVDVNHKSVERDFRINKIKGLLYGYYIGALLSTDKFLVREKNIYNELLDIFAAILSTNEHDIKSFQKNRIHELFQMVNTLPEYYIKETACLSDKIVLKLTDGLRNYYGLEAKNSDESKIIYELQNSEKDYNPALIWLDKKQSVLDEKINKLKKPLSTEYNEIITSELELFSIESPMLKSQLEKNIVKTWVNEIIISKDFIGPISAYNKVLARELTKRVVDLCGAEWENSEARESLNQMILYVNGKDSNPNWDSPLYSSITAVLSKGDNWEQLLRFLQKKSISDYRIAFAFYGELYGFANLTRDFTDLLFNLIKEGKKQYVAEVMKEINGQLLGESLEKKDDDMDSVYEFNRSCDYQQTINKNDEQCNHSFRDFMFIINYTINKQTKIYKAFKNSGLEDDCKLYCISEFRQKIYSLIACCKNKDKYKPLIEEAINLETYKNDEIKFTSLIYSQKQKVKDELIKHFFGRDEKVKAKNKVVTPSLFENNGIRQSAVNFDHKRKLYFRLENINDIKAVTSRFVSNDTKLEKHFYEDLKWFFDNKDKTSIDNFREFLEYQKTKRCKSSDPEWKMKIYKDLNIKEVIAIIKENFISDNE